MKVTIDVNIKKTYRLHVYDREQAENIAQRLRASADHSTPESIDNITICPDKEVEAVVSFVDLNW